jgi:hypothetical protein
MEKTRGERSAVWLEFMGMIKIYKAGKGTLYIFDLSNMKVKKYGFKPLHKRLRIRKLFRCIYSWRFILLCDSDFLMNDPEKYLETSETQEWKELKLGDYL